jgi:hypothetical protein
MGHLQNYVNNDESDEQAKDNKRVDLQYKGPLSHLLVTNAKGVKEGVKGDGYYIVAEDRWYFRPQGSTEEYRLKAESLNFIGK